MERATRIPQALFCAECAKRLQAADFFAGRAIFLGDRPFCDPCRRPVLGTPFGGGARRLPRNRQLL